MATVYINDINQLKALGKTFNFNYKDTNIYHLLKGNNKMTDQDLEDFIKEFIEKQNYWIKEKWHQTNQKFAEAIIIDFVDFLRDKEII